VIAATGELTERRDGTVEPVGWVGLKAAAAAHAHATLLLVPKGDEVDAYPAMNVVYGVTDLQQALAVLQQTGEPTNAG
jgi:predicted S18 family serine protease